MQKLLSVLLITLCLTACGGGGGGGGSASSASANNAAATPALTFSPASITQTVPEGATSTINILATVNTPSNFSGATAVYAYVVDGTGVLLPTTQIIQNSPTQYSVILQTAATLAPGAHQGNFTVELCKDSKCASQFPGSPMQLPYAIQVTSASAPFSASAAMPANAFMSEGGASPSPTVINVATTGLTWTATSTLNWVSITNPTGSGNGSFTLHYDGSQLGAGQYSGVVTVTASDGQVSTIPVALTIQGGELITNSSSVYFNAINGAPIPSQNITFGLADGAADSWTISSDSIWLTVTPQTGSMPGLATFSANPTLGKLSSGTYTGNARLSSSASTSSLIPVQLQLTKPTLSLSTNSVALGGTYGRDFTTPQSLTLGLNTATNAWPWTLSQLPPWGKASASNGTVNQAGSSVNFTANASAPVGTTTAIFNAVVAVNGDTLSTPVALTINKDQHKILASQTGVAFASTPTWSRLTKSLTISDNYGQTPNWSATSNQSWINISQSGNTLTLSADPTSLPIDTTNYATITLSSSDSTISAPEPIKIALWKGSTTPTAMTQIQQAYTNIIADPIRPFVYVNNGGNSVDVYNIYTAQKTATVSALGTSLDNMTISSNGDHLYALDTSSNNLIVVNLMTPTPTKINSWSLNSSLPGQAVNMAPNQILSIRPNGVEIILTNSGTEYLASSGKPLATINTNPSSAWYDMAASADGKRVYLQGDTSPQISTVSSFVYNLDYSEMGGGTLFFAQEAAIAYDGSDIAVSADGSRLYSTAGGTSQCHQIVPDDLLLVSSLPSTGGTSPNNVKVGSDGRVYCGITSSGNTATAIWVFSINGTLLTSFNIIGHGDLLDRQMAVSGDGLIVTALAGNSVLSIIPVGP
ncbi:BACON domain-containing protein [Glaciimonas soli]|uniref:Quinoprotein amine dehydrogenase n=1 Tax=Glaciimonas soli TaxID=2590999 RepID=A0A843YRJ7_9BURK|nr:quinoprotein amine dehydrogenase [Glaciimonas soli]MQR00354.1 quinoprotein amine dehydrogenase [Glaciimonas soli]